MSCSFTSNFVFGHSRIIALSRGECVDRATEMDDDACACLASSAAAGVLGTALVHPLDTAAVLRSTGQPLPRWQQAHQLYRGLGPAALQGALIYGALLGCFEWFMSRGCTLPQAAALSAIPEGLVRGPLEAWKNLTQTRTNLRGSQLGRSLVQGTIGTLAREVPGNTVYFMMYDRMRNSSYGAVLSGLCTGAVYTLVVYPIESMRTQLVTGVRPVRPTYRGSGPYLARAALITCFVRSFYECMLGKQTGQGMQSEAGKASSAKTHAPGEPHNRDA